MNAMMGEHIITTLGEGEDVYEIIYPEIWRGNSGIVYRTSNRNVCAKKITLSVDMAMEELREFKKMQNNRFIVKYHDFFKVGPVVWELMEYCSLGNIEMYMASGEPANLARQIRVIHQIAQGLHHLHSHGVTHRDIVPANILLQYEHKDNVAKLCNFSVAIEQVGDMTAVVGTSVYFKAPELFAASPLYDKSIDTFALGLIAVCMLRYEKVERFKKWRPCSAGYCGDNHLPENYCIGRELLGATQMHLTPPIIVSRELMESDVVANYKVILQQILADKANERMDASETVKELEKLEKGYESSPSVKTQTETGLHTHALETEHPPKDVPRSDSSDHAKVEEPLPHIVVSKSLDTIATLFTLMEKLEKHLKDRKTNPHVMFGEFDKHRKCRLSRKEFGNGFRHYNRIFKDIELDILFKHLDINKDGYIDAQELMEAVIHHREDRHEHMGYKY